MSDIKKDSQNICTMKEFNKLTVIEKKQVIDLVCCLLFRESEPESSRVARV